MGTGLRERKKQQTREAIHRAAMKLFAARGFEATTIADIAEAADISPRTFFSYFPSKEDVIFVRFEPAMRDLERALREREPSTSALQALRSWLHASAKHHIGDADSAELEMRLVRESPTVAACDLRNLRRFERLLAEAVAEDFGEPPDALRPRLVVAAAIAALQASQDRAHQLMDEDPEAARAILADPTAFIDEALRFLEGGLAALRS